MEMRMWYLIVMSVLGLIGGFGSVSRGRLFQRASGTVVLGSIFIIEVGLSVYCAFRLGVLSGIGLFLFGWLVMGHIGSFLFRATYHR